MNDQLTDITDSFYLIFFKSLIVSAIYSFVFIGLLLLISLISNIFEIKDMVLISAMFAIVSLFWHNHFNNGIFLSKISIDKNGNVYLNGNAINCKNVNGILFRLPDPFSKWIYYIVFEKEYKGKKEYAFQCKNKIWPITLKNLTRFSFANRYWAAQQLRKSKLKKNN